jgi:hypothetical protein
LGDARPAPEGIISRSVWGLVPVKARSYLVRVRLWLWLWLWLWFGLGLVTNVKARSYPRPIPTVAWKLMSRVRQP